MPGGTVDLKHNRKVFLTAAFKLKCQGRSIARILRSLKTRKIKIVIMAGRCMEFEVKKTNILTVESTFSGQSLHFRTSVEIVEQD